MHPEPLHPEPLSATWRDQLIELDLPGLGPISASADPALWEPPAAPEHTEEDDLAFRRRRPTAPPEPEEVRATLQDRVPLELEHTWLVVPALGPVLPTAAPEGHAVGDLSGAQTPLRGAVRARADPCPAEPGGVPCRGVAPGHDR